MIGSGEWNPDANRRGKACPTFYLPAAGVSRRSVLSLAAAIVVAAALPEAIAVAGEEMDGLVMRDGWILRATDVTPVRAA